jgi:hypothetical protein
MRQAAAGEEREFLAQHQGVQAINGRNPSLNVVPGVNAGDGVDDLTVDIGELVG